MSAAKLDLVVEQGATFKFTWTWIGKDLSGASAIIQVRSAPAIAPALEMSTANARLSINVIPPSGSNPVVSQIVAFVSAADTAALTPASALFYDLKITESNGDVTRLTEGESPIRAQISV